MEGEREKPSSQASLLSHRNLERTLEVKLLHSLLNLHVDDEDQRGKLNFLSFHGQ